MRTRKAAGAAAVILPLIFGAAGTPAAATPASSSSTANRSAGDALNLGGITASSRSCSWKMDDEYRRGQSSEVETQTVYAGSVHKTLKGGPINANATRRKCRDQIKACMLSLWDTRSTDLVPTVCKGMNINLEGDSLLQAIVTDVYEALGKPQKGDLGITVHYRIWGDVGCGPGNSKSMHDELGTINVDFRTGDIHSGGLHADFVKPKL